MPARRCRIERARGSGDFVLRDNPLDESEVLEAVRSLDPAQGSFVSLTGGEPLLQSESVGELAQGLRAAGLRVHLETHGLHVDALADVLAGIDVVSMDWKLESDVRWHAPPPSNAASFHERHEAFLRLARSRAEVYVKVVVSANTRPDELDAVCARLAESGPDVPLVLQPVSAFGRFAAVADPGFLLACLWRCEARHSDVRLIPQTHRSYGVL